MNLEKNLNLSTLKETFKTAITLPAQLVSYLSTGKFKLSIWNNYERNISDPQIREIAEKEKAGAYDELIRNYKYKDDLIGSFGYRPGKTYNILPDGSIEEADDEDGLDNRMKLKWGHEITNFTDNSNSPIPDIYDKDGNISPR